MKIIAVSCSLVCICIFCNGWYAYTQALSADKLPQKNWNAYWLTNPDISGNEYAIACFRKEMELPGKPDRFWIAISGDNKYTLYVNETKVSFGPQLSDILHWRYDTINIAPYLRAGNNTIAVEIINFGPDRFFGHISQRTAFVIQALDSEIDARWTSAINTRPENRWLTTINTGHYEKPVKWRVAPREKDVLGGLYAVNPCDSVVADAYLWDWYKIGINTASWKPAIFVENATSNDHGFAWLLEPRNIPMQRQELHRLAYVLKAEGVKANANFLKGNAPITIPAHSRALLWLDNQVLTIGYPALRFSKGRNARIRVGYAEALFEPNSEEKGNRNEWQGKRFVGITDVVVADGKPHTWQPTWLRCFRFVQIEIITAQEPLVLHDFYNEYTTTSVPVIAHFLSANVQHNQVFDICKRTLELCTQDYYLSDSYYETMQYIGDTKVHAITWQELSGNYAHTRNALLQFHHSRIWDGNLGAAYPQRTNIVIPTYSIIWINMLYDYFKQTGDTAFLQPMKSGIYQTLQMFEDLMTADSLNGSTRWWYFIDWYAKDDWAMTAPGGDGTQSAIVTLQYVYALQHAAALMEAMGSARDAQRYSQRADELNRRVRSLCFDQRRGLFAQKADKAMFDQHTNIFAILTGAAPEEEYVPMLEKILTDTSLLQATLYFRFYLWEALMKAKASHLFTKAMDPWVQTLRDGVTTTIERHSSPAQSARSECHPWSTSPIYAFYRMLAGIEYGPPGSKLILMQPSLTDTDWIEGTYPHPAGNIGFRFEKAGSRLKGMVQVPEGIHIQLRVNGTSLLLQKGQNRFE